MPEIEGYRKQKIDCCDACKHAYHDYDAIIECQENTAVKAIPGEMSRWVDPLGICPRFEPKE